MAGEFGISSDEVITLLRQMDVPVRSHLTLLTDDQVSRIRARWEREKRVRAEKQTAPPARRRRGTAAAAPAAAAPAASAPAEATGIRRRRRAETVEDSGVATSDDLDVDVAAPDVTDVEHDTVVEHEPEVSTSPAIDSREHAEEDTVRVVTPPPAPPAPPVAAAPPPAPPAAPREPERVERTPTPPEPMVPMRPAMPPPPPASGGAERPRPRPIVPGAPRPRPVASSTPFVPPRPVASAAPGGGMTPTRRDDRPQQQRQGGGSGGGQQQQQQQQQQQSAAGRRKKGKRGAVDQEAVSANIFKTMSALRGPAQRRGGPRRPDDMVSREELEAAREADRERERKTVHVNEFITVSELAEILKIPATQIVGFAFKNLGLMVTINQRMDFDQIELIAGEFGFQAVREAEYAADAGQTTEADKAEDLVSRPPIVTIMGHVDHGKTSLLDYIRKANVVAGEAGGITQHIGAYHVTLPSGKLITFLDTPGHEAFTAMRARGAQVTDIVVLVVASNDSVMPQTIEAISHARNAGVPLIVAINKIDLPDANPTKVSQDLLQHGVVLEAFGGTVLSTPISAKKGTGVNELLDQVLLQAEILDLKANPAKNASGTVVEAQLDAGKGPVATVLVQSGTLKVGDDFIVGLYSGRVRAMLDERGKPVKSAGPAIPVQVLGVTGVPMAGDEFRVVEDATQAREIAQRRERLDREAKSRRTSKSAVTLEDFMSHASAGEKRTLRVLIKADQGGPAEALADALAQLSNAEVQVEVIHRGVGAVTESDILLARAAGAIIVGFHVRPDNNARSAAEREGVEIKLYKVIYDAVNDVRAALEGMLRPEEREVVLGEAEVRETFKAPKVGVVAGCSVRSGTISRQARVRVIRNGVEVYDGTIGSLRRFKDDVREVKEGYECGISIENFNDIKVGDVIECYRTEEVARTLVADASS
jgi:translation initiation factor IF-2